jgi:hypothetical protein
MYNKRCSIKSVATKVGHFQLVCFGKGSVDSLKRNGWLLVDKNLLLCLLHLKDDTCRRGQYQPFDPWREIKILEPAFIPAWLMEGA